MRPLFRFMLPAALAGALLSAVPAAATPLSTTTPASAAAAERSVAERSMTEPSVTVLSPVADSTIPLGEVSVRMAVDLAGEPSGRIDVTLGHYVSGAAIIEAGTCDAGCEVTVALTVGEWDRTGPAHGTMMLSAKLTTASGLQTFGGGSLYITGPTTISDLQFVRDGQLFPDGVADAVGNFRVSVEGAPGEAVAELRLIDSVGVARLTASAPFSVSRGLSKDALFALDLSGLPDGLYRAETRARNTDGYYGYGRYTFVRVTHANQAGFDLGEDKPKVVGWAGVGGSLQIQGPLLSGSKPSTVTLTVDGATREVAVTPAAWIPQNWQQPTAKQGVGFSMQGPELTLGTHQVELRLLDAAGRLIGKPTTRTVLVSDFKAKATAPTLVVGRRSTVTLSADGPTGHPLQRCDIELAAPQAIDNAPIGRFCTTGLQALRTTAPVTPRASGAHNFGFSLDTGVYQRLIVQPATVYAARRATVTAPAVRYGQRGTAKVVVQDNHKLGVWSAAPAGVNVTLQRQVAGSTTWATVGSVKTVAGGIASIPFTSVTNGSFRAVLASSVPAETVVTPAIPAVSVANVAWRSAPTAATRGRSVTYSVVATPYDAGAVAYLQVRKPGSTVWTSVRSVVIPTSTVANLAYAFPATGTWGVRVLRGTTKQHAGGYSSVAAVVVR
ncbi:hypothetical protein [Kribbella deserti]|uniref:Uncharacterized protein n=1 Tax=Kribbella deserti TaxID=1926257 RepID=A0ABV6QP75_9ACTN